MWAETPLKDYSVEKGKSYRFRIIGSGMIFPFRVSVDNHLLTVVAADGFDVQPMTVESIIISPGERFDFILTANQIEENYWIRADSLEVRKEVELEYLNIIFYIATEVANVRAVKADSAVPYHIH